MLPAVLEALTGTYRLPYQRATMHVGVDGRRVEYRSARKGAAAAIVVETGRPLTEPGGRARFLTERYPAPPLVHYSPDVRAGIGALRHLARY